MSDRAFEIWLRVAARLRKWEKVQSLFRYGQDESVAWIAERLPKNGLLVADEVGLGKTRIALLAMYATMLEGGTVAAVVPPGLLFQWQEEADNVLDSLKAMEPSVERLKSIAIRSYGDLFMSADDRLCYPLCSATSGTWPLISQAFDLYIIKKGAVSWRLELPALVNAYMREKKGEDRNNRWSQYLRKRGYEQEIEESSWCYNYCKAAEFLAKGGRNAYPTELREVFDDDYLRPDTRNGTNANDGHRARQECVQFFQNGRPGRNLLMNMVGKLVGRIDLLVMDEAHKSREYQDAPEKRFGRLVDEILVASPQARRIGMTATPVELDAEQWSTLLRRIHGPTGHAENEQVVKAITQFAERHGQVIRHPDQLKDIEALIEAASTFSHALSPMVTRRRRLHQPEWSSLLPRAIKDAGAHPHRDYRLCPIEVKDLDDSWRKMLMALESQGVAAKGISDYGLAHRQTDIRYAYGLNCEFDELEDEIAGTGDRKEQRARFWQRLQKNLSAEISGETGNWLWNHPRILRSADRIEELCSIDDGRPKDKVLVFGRFTEPLRALCDVLNARHLLRIIDSDILAFPPRVDDARLLRAVWKERRERGTKFRGALAAPNLTQADLRAMARDAHHRYESERDRLTHLVSADREALWRQLPGDNAITELGKTSKAKQRALFTILRAEVFDIMLHDGRDVGSVTLHDLRKLLMPVWKEHCVCMLHGHDDILTADGQLTEENEKLAAKANQLSPEILVDYFGLGKPGESDARSQFSRVLDGGVKPRTRRSIQSGFNHRGRGPHVLVAQSLVGREGLNLHKACRKVFLLHPEWNPGIMEQQIGRVDRIESLWTRMAKEWLDSHGTEAPPDDFPRIEVESVVFKGTYDEFQFQILSERRKSLNAQLFGELLDEQTLARIPPEYREKVASAAPDWSPTKSRPT